MLHGDNYVIGELPIQGNSCSYYLHVSKTEAKWSLSPPLRQWRNGEKTGEREGNGENEKIWGVRGSEVSANLYGSFNLLMPNSPQLGNSISQLANGRLLWHLIHILL